MKQFLKVREQVGLFFQKNTPGDSDEEQPRWTDSGNQKPEGISQEDNSSQSSDQSHFNKRVH